MSQKLWQLYFDDKYVNSVLILVILCHSDKK